MKELNTREPRSGADIGCLNDRARSGDEERKVSHQVIFERPEVQLATEWAHLNGG